MRERNSFQKQLDWIDRQQTSMLQLLIDWSHINSSSDNLEGLAHMLAALKTSFGSLDATLHEINIPSSTSIDPKGNLTLIPHGKALHLSKRPHAKIQILLAGHMDTVYPASHNFQKTQLTSPNMLQGPGVADMKGGLVIMLTALEAFEQHPASESLGWEILITSDEEIGSIGSEPLFLEAAKRVACGLIFEPSFSDGAIVSARKGSSNYTVVSTGKAAHSGRDFEKGKNAILPLAEFILAAYKLNDLEKGLTFNIGRIEGGGPVNVVPDFASCGINVRAVNAEDFIKVPLMLQHLIADINQSGAALKLHSHHMRSPKPFDAKNQKLFALIEKCAVEEGYPLATRPSGGVCDGNILSEAGVAVIDTMGAIGGHIHSPEEYIVIDSLKARARLTALLLFNLASGNLKL